MKTNRTAQTPKPQRQTTPPAEQAARWLASTITTTARALAVRRHFADTLTWRRFGPADSQIVGLAVVPAEGEPHLELMPLAELDRLADLVPDADVHAEMRRLVEARARRAEASQPDDLC